MAHRKAQIERLVGRIITAIVMIHQGFSELGVSKDGPLHDRQIERVAVSSFNSLSAARQAASSIELRVNNRKCLNSG